MHSASRTGWRFAPCCARFAAASARPGAYVCKRQSWMNTVQPLSRYAASVQIVTAHHSARGISSSATHDGDAYNYVIAAVGDYIDALHTRNSPHHMQRIWNVVHPSAHFKRLDDKRNVEDIPAATFLRMNDMTDENIDPESLEYWDLGGRVSLTDCGDTRIVNIDMLHPDKAAMATIVHTMHPKKQTEFLNLLQLDHTWVIVHNVSTSIDDSTIAYTEDGALVQSHISIATALTKYFSAAHHCDSDLMEEVLHPTCITFSLHHEHGTLHKRDRHTFLRDMIRSKPSAATTLTDKTFDKIVSVQKSGPDSAMAKVQIGLPHVGRLFTYHLGLLKEQGRWMIVSQTYVDELWRL